MKWLVGLPAYCLPIRLKSWRKESPWERKFKMNHPSNVLLRNEWRCDTSHQSAVCLTRRCHASINPKRSAPTFTQIQGGLIQGFFLKDNCRQKMLGCESPRSNCSHCKTGDKWSPTDSWVRCETVAKSSVIVLRRSHFWRLLRGKLFSNSHHANGINRGSHCQFRDLNNPLFNH